MTLTMTLTVTLTVILTITLKRLCADSAGCAAGVYNAWSKVPQEGKLQILCLLLALETANESKKPHYMRGGVPGRIDSLPFDRAAGTSGLWAPKIKFWDPLNFTGALSAEQKARKRKAELKNGCAAPPCAVRVRSRAASQDGRPRRPAAPDSPPLQPRPQPPRDDRHGLFPHRPQPARLRPRPHLGVLSNPDCS